MGIRIQPREIDVPADDPFKHDLLARKEPVESLTNIVRSLEGPCVLAVDAEWGKGKTTFLKMWEQYLRNEKFSVVKFNAWETDFSGDPFVALSTELTEGLHEYKDEQLKTKITDMKKMASEVLRRAVPGMIRHATEGILDLNQLFEKEAGQALASYQETKKSVEEFRKALQDMADTLSQSSGNRPLIVVVDELDRCRPSYAVELLEVAKHVFAVNHIVFVLAVNCSELAHSIKALYGSRFDAAGYLRRFFDVDFRLPDPDRGAFIDAMLNAVQIKEHLDRWQDNDRFRKLLKSFFRASDLSLRQIQQAIHRLGLVLALLRGGLQELLAEMTGVALILRTIDQDLYHRFVGGEVSDLDVVDAVFSSTRAKTLQREYESCLFEAAIIAAAWELTTPESNAVESITTPLLRRYRDLVADNASHDPERKRAEEIIKIVEHFEEKYDFGVHFKRSVGFKWSVQQIELLSQLGF